MKHIKRFLALIILTYFRVLARIQLQKNNKAIIIGITGSSGKTSTHEALTLILKEKGRVKDSKNANSESGIPLNILGLAPKSYTAIDWLRLLALAPLMLLVNWERYDYYVVEMGIDSPDSPKNMDYLLKIVQPDVGVVLNAGLVHGGAFDHLIKDRDPNRRAQKIRQEIAKEKMKLLSGISPAGVVIYNSDQQVLRPFAKDLKARVIKFGRLKGANFQFTKPKVTSAGFSYSFRYQGKTHTLTLPDLLDPNFAYTFSAAIAAAASIGISPSSSISTLGKYRAPAGRLRIFRGINNSTIIDSSYNSSPDAQGTALKLLSSLAKTKPRLAIIGDMRELGKESKHAHKLLADWLIKNTDQAILFGKETKEHTLPILESHKFPAKHFSKMSSLIEYLKESLPDGAYVLVKGSQNQLFLERAVEAILRDSKDSELLCRRGKYWDKIRTNTK